MPRKLYDENGAEIEVPTEDELKDIQNKAELASTAEEYKKLITDLGLKEGEKLSDYIETLKQESNPNWKQARNKISILEKFAKDNGVEFDEQGNIKKKETIDPEKLKEDMKATARNEFFEQYRDGKLAKITDPEKRKVVKSYYDKLSAGEEMTHENIDKFINSAMQLAEPGKSNAVELLTGTPPNINEGEKNDFSESNEGQSAAENLGLHFATDKKGEDKK